MRDDTSYEWTAELLDANGDIVDSDFSARLKNMDTTGRRVALVRQTGNPHDGVTHRTWAYVESGRIPAVFDDGSPVPRRYIREWYRYQIS